MKQVSACMTRPGFSHALRLCGTVGLSLLVAAGMGGCGKPEAQTKPPAARAKASVTAQAKQEVAPAREAPAAVPPEPYAPRKVGPAAGTLVFESYRPRGISICVMEIGGKEVRQLRMGGTPVCSPDGSAIAVVLFHNDTGRFEICVVTFDGGDVKRLTQSADRDSRAPAWSPDGKLIAFEGAAGNDGDIYVMKADGSGARVLAAHAAHDGTPTWSPDGKQIAFASQRHGDSAIFVMTADGTDVKQITERDVMASDPAWSPDGTYIAWVARHRPDRKWVCDLRVVKPDGTGKRTLLAQKETIASPTWSPGSDWLAFSCKDATSDIHIIDINGDGHTVLLNDKEQDGHPSWRPAAVTR